MSETIYEKFKRETGLEISRATFFRLRKETQSGNSSRLTRIINNEVIPKHERPSFKKHGDKDITPFLSYDGEGITLEGKHRYILLACSNGESSYRPNGLSTVDALNFLLRSSKDRRIRIFYSFGYDIQQILVDVDDRTLVRIMHSETVKWRNYRITYLPGKIFSVNNVRFYDVFNYWQTSFIKAVTESLGKDAVSASLIEGKNSRSDFADWPIEKIISYTNEELDLLVQLADHLRDILIRTDIHLGSAFYGPGSIANYWFKKHKISPPKITDPILVDVMERAYYGGRFETFQLGKTEPIYECDINSAYPSIIGDLPYLDDWEWTPGIRFSESTKFSVWKVEWHLPSTSKIGPFPSRDKHGLISYPANGIGWYWKPEIEAALALYGNSYYRITQGYVPKVIEGQPFEWVRDIYARRLELKSNADPAQWALKVGLNSIYGKTAQRVGKAQYFSLAWAGYITSSTRAKLLTIATGQETSLIAFATDAAYFTKQPNIGNSTKLGGWSTKLWSRGYFIQSGVYRLESPGNHKDAYRGFSVKNGIQDLLDQIKENPFKHPSIYQLKFISHLEAIRCPKTLGPFRLMFINVKKKLQPFKTTKRRASDPRVWQILEDDGKWIDNEVGITIRSHRGNDYISLSGYGMAWNYYTPLLSDTIDTTILDNHNDHSDYLHMDLGDLEESYPFARITLREGDIAFHDTDEVAVERVGGANGIIDLAQVGRLPIVDEEDILKELHP